MVKTHTINRMVGAALVAMLAASGLLVGSPARAAVTSLVGNPTFTSDVGAGSYYDGAGGLVFTAPNLAGTGSNAVVTALGRFYFGPGTYSGALNQANANGWTNSPPYYYATSAGNEGVRTLSLIKVTSLGAANTPNSSTGQLIAKVTLDAAANPKSDQTIVGSITGGWQYATLSTPALLDSGATYVLVGSQLGYFGQPVNALNDGQMYANWDKVTTLVTGTGFSYVGADLFPSNSWNGAVGSLVSFDYYNSIGTGHQVGPLNLQFELIVPEPSTVLLLGLGGLLLRRKNRRSRQS